MWTLLLTELHVQYNVHDMYMVYGICICICIWYMYLYMYMYMVYVLVYVYGI